MKTTHFEGPKALGGLFSWLGFPFIPTSSRVTPSVMPHVRSLGKGGLTRLRGRRAPQSAPAPPKCRPSSRLVAVVGPVTTRKTRGVLPDGISSRPTEASEQIRRKSIDSIDYFAWKALGFRDAFREMTRPKSEAVPKGDAQRNSGSTECTKCAFRGCLARKGARVAKATLPIGSKAIGSAALRLCATRGPFWYSDLAYHGWPLA